MAFNINLSKKLKDETFLTGYDEMCDVEHALDPVEVEMDRYFLECAQTAGLIDSFSEKEYMTMEA